MTDTITIPLATVHHALEALAIADNIALVGAAYTPKSIDLGLRKIRESATALRKALEQPEQEPVACRFCHSEKGSWTWQCYKCGEIDDVQQPAAQPEQRKPLTRDEIAEVAERMEATDAASSFWREFARAIEAAHGIKEKT
jgi:hypothetical protein